MPRSAPVATVVIPVYDRVQELHECLMSALDQDEPQPYEVICVLDGSPDPTRRLVDQFAESSSNLRIISRSESSGNAVRARNLGILSARSEIVLLLDSDDVMTHTRVSMTVEAFSSSDVGLVAGCAKYFSDGSRDLGVSFGETQKPLDISTALLSRINPFVTSTVAIRREILLQHGGFRCSMQYREDHELWLRLSSRGVKMLMMSGVLAHYRIHSGNNEKNFIESDGHWRHEMFRMAALPYLDDEWGTDQ